MNLPSGLAEAIVAALIVAIGLSSIALSALRSAPGDRAPLWFGLFGGLYGIRLAGDSALLQPLFPEVLWRYSGAFVTYVIVVPGILFVEMLLGPGWRSILRRSWQAAAACAGLSIVNDLARGQPGATLWLNRPIVLAVGGIVVAHLAAHRGKWNWTREFQVALLGGVAFLCVAGVETVRGEGRLEYIAMLIFMVLVGYAVTHRMLATERRFVAVCHELEIAREIQQSILPRALPETNGLRLAACYLPMSEVGGDFYDFDTGRADGLGLIIADVSGHGVPAALVASMVKMGFAAEAGRVDRPGLVLGNINRMLSGKFAGAYVTACCGFIDVVERRLRYSSAGHPSPILRRADGRLEELDERGLLLAFDGDAEYVTAEVGLEDGDRLVFFSDGLIEARDAAGDFYESARLERRLVTNRATTPDRFVEELVADLRDWVGPGVALEDDVTVVVIDIGTSAPVR